MQDFSRLFIVGPTNYYLSLVMAVTLGLSVVPLMGLAIISSVSFCCSQKTISKFEFLPRSHGQ